MVSSGRLWYKAASWHRSAHGTSRYTQGPQRTASGYLLFCSLEQRVFSLASSVEVSLWDVSRRVEDFFLSVSCIFWMEFVLFIPRDVLQEEGGEGKMRRRRRPRVICMNLLFHAAVKNSV